MDEIGSHRAVLLGLSEGCPMSAFFAAANPERVSKFIVFGGFAKSLLTEAAVSHVSKSGHRRCDEPGDGEPVYESGRGQNVRQIERLSASPGAAKHICR